MMMPSMVDMKLDTAATEAAEGEKAMLVASCQPTYPYGLCISLTEEELEKLGLDEELPPIGATLHFMAMAKVTSVSQNERTCADGTTERCCRVELQIQQMSTEHEEAEAPPQRAGAFKRYNSSGAEEAA